MGHFLLLPVLYHKFCSISVKNSNLQLNSSQDANSGCNYELKIEQLEIKKGHLRFIESETLLFQSTGNYWDMILWKIMVFCLRWKLVLDCNLFHFHPVREVLQDQMKIHVLNLWREDFFNDGLFHCPAVFLMMELVFQSMILFTSKNTLSMVIKFI